MGWPGIYSIYYSQLEGSKDSFPLDGIFPAFIDIKFNKCDAPKPGGPFTIRQPTEYS